MAQNPVGPSILLDAVDSPASLRLPCRAPTPPPRSAPPRVARPTSPASATELRRRPRLSRLRPDLRLPRHRTTSSTPDLEPPKPQGGPTRLPPPEPTDVELRPDREPSEPRGGPARPPPPPPPDAELRLDPELRSRRSSVLTLSGEVQSSRSDSAALEPTLEFLVDKILSEVVSPEISCWKEIVPNRTYINSAGLGRSWTS